MDQEDGRVEDGVNDAELSARISNTANAMSFADRLAAEGMATVVADAEGKLIERHPDGVSRTL